MIADLQAMIDVLDEVIENSDSFDGDTALAYREAAEAVRKKAADAVAMLDTQLKKQLEAAPRKFGDKVYAVVDDGKWRPDHRRIRETVIERAVEIGLEAGDEPVKIAYDASNATYQAMMEIFVSPSDKPKVSGLESIGLTKKQGSYWEHTGSKIEVTDTRGS